MIGSNYVKFTDSVDGKFDNTVYKNRSFFFLAVNVPPIYCRGKVLALARNVPFSDIKFVNSDSNANAW